MSNVFPPAKQQFVPSSTSMSQTNAQQQPLLNTFSELEGPDEAAHVEKYEPDQMARLHFLIHSNKLLQSFANAFPACSSTQMAKNFFMNMFPNLPIKIDYATHNEMKYALNEKQKAQVDEWINQFYKVMTHKVQFNGKEFQVSQYFQYRKQEGWSFVIQHVKLIQLLNLPAKWNNMSDTSKEQMWRYMDLLFKDSKEFVGFKNLENLIPKEMKIQLENMICVCVKIWTIIY